MKIPIGIFFGGATTHREHSFQTARRVHQLLSGDEFDPLIYFVDPFGQLIYLENGFPNGDNIYDFYPSKEFAVQTGGIIQFPLYPEHLDGSSANLQKTLGQELGEITDTADLPQQISIAFLALTDIKELQQNLEQLRIPYTGEIFKLFDLCADRLALRTRLQTMEVELPAALKLTAADWKQNSLQAIWGEDSAHVAYPLLLRPSRQHAHGRSSVVNAKDGPEGLRTAIDLAFGQKRLAFEDWLDMSPLDREELIRQLAQWSSGIGFPLELDTGSETMTFQHPATLLDHLRKLPADGMINQLVFKAQPTEKAIIVSSLPEGTAVSCLLIRQEDQSWEAADLRLLGGASAMVQGTEERPMKGDRESKVSDSMSQQIVARCIELTSGLPASSGIRYFGVLTPDGQFLPEEVQAFIGPLASEKITSDQLKSFIIASLQARLNEHPEPAYRSLMDTLTSVSTEETDQVEALTTIENGNIETSSEDAPVESESPPSSLEEAREPGSKTAASVMEAPIETQVLYEHEMEKLKKEKEHMPQPQALYSEPKDNRPFSEKLKAFWESTKAFFTSRIFLRNLGAMAVFLILFFLLTVLAMRLYTRHGDSMQLEDFQGLLLEDAEKRARTRGLKIKVMDTSFRPKARPNEIISQYPEPLSKVKEDRTVFVVITQNKGEEVVLPSLAEVGDDFDTYRRELRKQKIDLTMRDQVFNAKLAEGTILYLVIEGERITETQLKQGKVKVEQGSAVEAVITTRTSNIVEVPNLVCKTFNEARFYLTGVNLMVGKVIGGTQSTRNNYYVYKQDPAFVAGKAIPKGGQIDVYLTLTKPDGCP